MAPVKPHRRTARAKIASKTKSQLGKYAPPSPTAPEDPITTDTDVQDGGDDEFGFGVGLKLNKKDKRVVKHNTLLNRVREGGIGKSSTATKKRRRPGKKLVTDVSSLGDALPDIEDEEEEEGWEGISEDEDMVAAVKKRKRVRGVGEGGKMEMKSLKHRPGAMKRKGVLEEQERERFGRNLAGLMGGSGGAKGAASSMPTGNGAGSGHSDRWAALRGFIGATLETDKAFAAK